VCTTHDIAFHLGETCAAYDERLAHEAEEEEGKKLREDQEEKSAEEVKRCATVCPGCGVPIQKVSGCDHMTCKTSFVLILREKDFADDSSKVESAEMSSATCVVRRTGGQMAFVRLVIRHMRRVVSIILRGCRAIRAKNWTRGTASSRRSLSFVRLRWIVIGDWRPVEWKTN
jgi:hypothetical protein